MASQFTGTDKANLLSTALSKDSGDNIAITATSDSEVQGLAENDTVVLDSAVSNFTVGGGAGNDSIFASAAVTTSDVTANSGDDTLRLTADVTSSAVKGAKGSDTIYLSGGLASSSVYGGEGQDSITFAGATKDITNTLFKSSTGDNNYSITSQSFNSSSVVGGTGTETLTLTSTNEVEKSFVQMGGGLDTAKITADIDNTTVAGASDSIHVIGGFNSSFGGKGMM